jgi:hypothetical protein
MAFSGPENWITGLIGLLAKGAAPLVSLVVPVTRTKSRYGYYNGLKLLPRELSGNQDENIRA